MLDLREVSIRIAVIDQSVQVFRRFPNALLAAHQAEVLLLFAQHKADCLLLVIRAVELRHTRVCLGVILAEVEFRLSFFVSTLQEVLPLIQIGKGVSGSWICCAHTSASSSRPTHSVSPACLATKSFQGR